MLDLPRHFAERVADFETECARFKRSGRGREGVVFLGDSLVEGYPGPMAWVNRGIFSDHLDWPEHNVFERLGADRLHPDPRAILTLVGFNDLENEPDAIARHVNLYRFLLMNLAQLYPAARLGAFSLPPTRGAARHLNPRIAEFNQQLAEVAASLGVAFLDLHQRLYDEAERAARAGTVRPDGVHLTRRGYAELTALVESRAAELELATLRPPRLKQKVAQAWKRLRPPHAGESAAPSLPIDRDALAREFIAAYGKRCWSRGAGEEPDDALVRALIVPEVDFLCRYVETQAPLFRDLYLGSRASFYARNDALWAGKPEGLRSAFDVDRALWAKVVAPAAWGRLDRAFAELRLHVPAQPPKRIRLLFVGDCLLEDVELLLNGRLLREGLLAKVDFVLSRNPIEQSRLIREAGAEKFDGVVYSPLSWEFDPEFRNFLEPAFRSRRAMRRDVEAIWQRVSSVVRLLAASFECPVYVHNTAAAVRSSDEVRRAVKGLLTYPGRRFAREELSRRIGALLDEINATSFSHLVLIDELAAVRGLRDDLTLGRVLYFAEAIHPAALSCVVADQLGSYVVAAARLLQKKVVVCDLDFTLWDGVIGEGFGVRPQLGRQRVLQRLKQKGVVLAIASKNDPDKVVWHQGVLGADDFVASEIAWAPKVVGVKKIRDTLNLKTKDFVFIDDRADERSMLTQEFPDLTALDPCREQTWVLFQAWADLLGDDEGDRTQMYRERVEREKVLGDQLAEQAAAELFMKLQLKIDVQRAVAADLKRVHELINRTNQWNLLGSRCTYNEVKAWHESDRHSVYVARVSDKFGDMGLVCCAVVEVGDDALNIPVFVLSCRVFGYGVETVVLDRIKKDAAARLGAAKVKGRFVENAHNKPCRSMYEAHGFVSKDGVWVHPGGATSAPDPIWFGRPGAS